MAFDTPPSLQCLYRTGAARCSRGSTPRLALVAPRLLTSPQSSHHVTFPLSYSDIFLSCFFIISSTPSSCAFRLLFLCFSREVFLLISASCTSISLQCCYFLLPLLLCPLSELLPLSLAYPFSTHLISSLSFLHRIFCVTSHSHCLVYVQLFLTLFSFPFRSLSITQLFFFLSLSFLPFVCLYLSIPFFSPFVSQHAN